MSRPPLTRAQRIRYTLYAAAVTIAALAIVDGAIRLLERSGAVDTQRADDRPALEGSPWIVEGDWLVPDPALRSRMPSHRLRRVKGDAFRMILAGASFMAGVPYRGPGTIHFWLGVELAARYPDRVVEVANGAMSAMDSSVVRQVVEHAVQHEPDVVVVATCNNEGTLPPAEMTRRLHDLGTFRLFRRLLRDEVAQSDRPVHTPQDPDLDAVRERFRANLEGIVSTAAEAGVPLLLCTLPLNLRYEGDEAGLPLPGEAWDQTGTKYSPCVSTGQSLRHEGDLAGAARQLQTCDDVEALRWLGLVRYEQGQLEAAQALLSQYAEVMPRNRCRPSFNAIIREVAAANPQVQLVDLEAAIREAAPHGIPGPEQFTDYCHLNWEAQARVAGAIMDAMRQRQLPPWRAREVALPDRETIYRGALRRAGVTP